MYYRRNPDAEIVQLLKELLATTYLVYIQTQGAHWNVVGSDFPQLHVLFEKQYEELRDAVDEIAEHIRTYDVMSPGSAAEFLDLARGASVGTFQEVDFRNHAGGASTSELLSALIKNHKLVSSIAKQLASITEDDPQTNDLAAERVAAHNKIVWMLESTNRRRTRRRNPWW